MLAFKKSCTTSTREWIHGTDLASCEVVHSTAEFTIRQCIYPLFSPEASQQLPILCPWEVEAQTRAVQPNCAFLIPLQQVRFWLPISCAYTQDIL